MRKILAYALASFGLFAIQPAVANEHIFYMRPQGQFGKELATYWSNDDIQIVEIYTTSNFSQAFSLNYPEIPDS